MNILNFSTGISSATIGLLCKDEIDLSLRCVMPDEHPDSERFANDFYSISKINHEDLITPYRNVATVLFMFPTIGRHSKCRDWMKIRPRKLWELKNPGRHTYFWGYDCSEKNRAENLILNMPEHNHRFPLIERNLSKQDCHGICENIGLKRPAMYNLGFKNNNCIGCPKGGMWYWNMIRKYFPEKFNEMAILERERTDMKGKTYSFINGIYLDELLPDQGREEDEISTECGFMCGIEINKLNKGNDNE